MDQFNRHGRSNTSGCATSSSCTTRPPSATTRRSGTTAATMEVPDTLQQQAWTCSEADGRVFRDGEELFAKTSWVQVMHGQRLRPRGYHPLADLLGEEEIADYLDEIAGVIGACVDVMPTHAKFIADHCAAEPVTRALTTKGDTNMKLHLSSAALAPRPRPSPSWRLRHRASRREADLRDLARGRHAVRRRPVDRRRAADARLSRPRRRRPDPHARSDGGVAQRRQDDVLNLPQARRRQRHHAEASRRTRPTCRPTSKTRKKYASTEERLKAQQARDQERASARCQAQQQGGGVVAGIDDCN